MRSLNNGAMPMVLVIAAGVMLSPAAVLALSADEGYLDGLQGMWVMEGAVGGKPVRDTFKWEPATRSWSLLLESEKARVWSTFATYTLKRAAL